MISTNIKNLARWAGGRLFGSAENIVKDIKIDSRGCAKGDMFVCVVGEKNDGHNFAETAYKNGCKCFLMSNAEAAGALLNKHEDSSVILVQDTNAGFQNMASGYLGQFDVKRVAVTGSVGKTTTKELITAVLSEKYRTICTQKNLNTHLGLCLTCFLADITTQAMVFEMGMDRTGEIEGYCSWVKPEVCVITNIGITHLEKLGSKEAIARAKFEITKHLTKDCPLIYNCDSDFLDDASIGEYTAENFCKFPVGSSENARLRVLNIEDKGENGIEFTLESNGEQVMVKLPLLGVHNAENAALAFACGLWFGITPAACARGLGKVKQADKRLAAENLGPIYLIDDSYNASPASMQAAIKVLASVNAKRKIAVLADMYELGSEEKEGHLVVGRRAAEEKIDIIVCIGRNAVLYEQGALEVNPTQKCIKFVSLGTAMEWVLANIHEGDAILVKGSNSTRVSEIAQTIKIFFGGRK